MSATGDAVVLYRGPTPGWVFARYRPAGGAWGGEQEVLRNNYPEHAQGPDGRVRRRRQGGRARELPRAQRHDSRQRPRRSRRAWATSLPEQVLDDDGDPPRPSFGLRILQALVRHPQGAVAVWTRRSTSSNFNDDIVVSRLSGAGWETPRRSFDLPAAFYERQRGRRTTRARSCSPRTLAHRPPATDVNDVPDVDRALADRAMARPDTALAAGRRPRTSTATPSPSAAGRRSTSAGACTAAATSAPR